MLDSGSAHRSIRVLQEDGSDPFDDDSTLPYPRWPYPIPERRTGYPRLAPLCRWCMERTVSTVFYTLHHPHFIYLCEHCRDDLRMFIQRLAMHRAMTTAQATREVMRLIDLANEVAP